MSRRRWHLLDLWRSCLKRQDFLLRISSSVGETSHNVNLLDVCSWTLPQNPVNKYVRNFGISDGAGTYFRAVLTFGGYDKAEAKILQGRSLFNLVCSRRQCLLCMFQQLWCGSRISVRRGRQMENRNMKGLVERDGRA